MFDNTQPKSESINNSVNGQSKSLEEQLAEAKREIDDLKSQIMWMNRSYE